MYKIYTDSSSNLTNEIIKKYDIGVVALSYINNGEVIKSFNKDSDAPIKKFYEYLRAKDNLTTTCANEQEFLSIFEEDLKKGYDILYIGMSSSLSATYEMGANALKRLKTKYKNRKVYFVDSLLASLGEGLLVYYACLKKEEGKSIEEVYNYVNDIKMNVNSLFTVKTLDYLKRGGRISKFAYFLGKMTDVKPVLHVDDRGKLVSINKAIGRKRSLMLIAEKVANDIMLAEQQTIFISHGDCIEDAKTLAEMISKKVKVKGFVYNYIDPVIGVHSGPDTLAVFFMGKSRVNTQMELKVVQTVNNKA